MMIDNKKPNLYLVRHGQDKDNASGILNGHRNEPLTEKGKKQARQCANKMSNVNVDIIVSSPLLRALQTAKIIACLLNYKKTIYTEKLLIERDFGKLTGTPEKDIERNCKEFLYCYGTTHFLSGNGIEEYPVVYQRGKMFLNKIDQFWPGCVIVAVVHGDIGKMIRAARLGIAWDEGLKVSFPNAGIIKV